MAFFIVVNDEFMQLSLIVMEKLKEKIRAQGNEKIQKITKYPDTEEIEPPQEVPSFDEPEPQPKPLPDCPSLDEIFDGNCPHETPKHTRQFLDDDLAGIILMLLVYKLLLLVFRVNAAGTKLQLLKDKD
ncbi:hypothetical protein Tco_1556339 [Tanacetum coccineum]